MPGLAVQMAVLGLFALISGGLLFAWERGRLGVAALVLFVAALGVWVLELAALTTEYRGADEFATCGTHCSAVHFVSAIAFLAPPLLIALSGAAMLVSRSRRLRVRREDARGATP